MNGYFYRGVLNGELKDYQKAIDDFTKVIELKPDFASAYTYRGLYEYARGKKDNACSDFNKAKELGELRTQSYIDAYCAN